MFQKVSSLFPPNTHPVTIVSDPDQLLADESLLSELNKRGFTLLTESDPILLRSRIDSLKPWQVEKPVIVITSLSLEALPYDLWETAYHLQLSLHDYFPNLAYPIIQNLSPYQRARLMDCPQPATRFGQQLSAEFVLRQVFKLPLEDLARPSSFIGWLDEFHNGLAPLPTVLLAILLAHLCQLPVYTEWPLNDLLTDKAAFNDFIQKQWMQYVNKTVGDWGGTSYFLTKRRTPRLLSFDKDTALQDTLPRLVRTGSLAPLEVGNLSSAPTWARPALLVSKADRHPLRMAELSTELFDCLEGLIKSERWEDWQPIALLWAELNLLRADSIDPDSASTPTFLKLQAYLDRAFTSWLQERYTSLGSQRLPVPHHVHHVPHYLNYRRELGLKKIALIVLDGLALMDWLLIRNAWQVSQPDWHIDEKLLLAQIPTITSISRQALISGLRPADFAATIQTNSNEARQWVSFWTRNGIPPESCAYVSVDFRRDPTTVELTDPRLSFLCLVERTVDEIVHGNVLGNTDLVGSIKVWLDNKKLPQHLESTISQLLGQGFVVFITSDHGHTEATGIGQPNEGILAQTRGRRARIYSDRNIALQTLATYNTSLLWENDGLLPDDLYAILPDQRWAFAIKNQPMITHGGISIDEVIVPFIEITNG